MKPIINFLQIAQRDYKTNSYINLFALDILSKEFKPAMIQDYFVGWEFEEFNEDFGYTYVNGNNKLLFKDNRFTIIKSNIVENLIKPRNLDEFITLCQLCYIELEMKGAPHIKFIKCPIELNKD